MNKKPTTDAPASLKEWRTRCRLNQIDAASILGVTQGYYSKVERQRVAPRRTIARRITKKTGVSLESLMGLTS
jgi:DNA-binding XRE family transcriptional regulator